MPLVKVTFIDPEGQECRTVDAAPGMTLLKLAHFEGVDLEGACGGAMACSTCHLYVQEPWLGQLPPPEPEEEDMLDLAAAPSRRSRLGCQIILSEALDGIEVQLPHASRDNRG